MKAGLGYRSLDVRWWAVLLLLSLLTLPAAAKPSKIKDLADTVAAKPILSKFAAIIQASDLGTFLSSRGPFTLFVPTDSAFSKLPPGTLETLLQPENKVRLQDILLFHLVNGKRLTSKDLLKLPSVLSCQGTLLPIKTSHSGAQFVAKAKIVNADIRCLNGNIDEIDTVLMPQESALPPLAPPPPPSANTVIVPTAPTPGTNAAPVVPLPPGTPAAPPVSTPP